MDLTVHVLLAVGVLGIWMTQKPHRLHGKAGSGMEARKAGHGTMRSLHERMVATCAAGYQLSGYGNPSKDLQPPMPNSLK